jgi:DNA-binding beta-propeller fold protein YncE
MRELKHKCSRGGFAALILALAGLASACHSTTPRVLVSVSPPSAPVALQGTTTFFASVTGATDVSVTWQVDGVTGGNSVCGNISTNGLYTAPSALPATTACAGSTTTSTACNTTTNGTITLTSGCVLITAISNQDTSAMGTAAVILTSGVTITVTPSGTATMGTGEMLSFVATVTGSTNLNVNWMVNGTQGGNSTIGTITSTTVGNGALANAAIYTAPSPAPTPNAVTIEAQAVADTSQTQSISVTIITATAPTLSSIAPLQIPAGADSEDIYLSGASFLSTTSVLFSGQSVGTLAGGSVTEVNADLIRARIPSSLLGTPGTFTVAAEEQNGTTTPALQVQVVPVRPSLLGATPFTLAQNSPTTTVELTGGYFTPSTISEWNGHLVSSTPDAGFPRSLQATLSSSDLTEAGLFSIAVRTPAASPPRSAVDVSVRPSAAPSVFTTISGFSKTNGISGGPVAVALNDTTGIAVVVDQGLNALDLLDPAFASVASQVAVGTTPTSVAVDGLRNIALVTDTGSNDLAVVDLSAPALAATLPCVGSAPVAVGVDEVHGRALVVDQGGSAAFVLDTAHPMACPVVQAITSISRSGGTVTATLAAALTIPGGDGFGIVTISGVTDTSFNGTFVVLTGSGSSTLIWSQAGADASSTGGSAASGSVLGTVSAVTGTRPQISVLPQMGWAVITPGGKGTLTVVDLTRLSVVFTVSIPATTRGVAVNTESKSLLLAEPSSASGFLLSLLDQSFSSVSLSVGNVAAAVNPFTNVGLLVNPGVHEAFELDLSTPSELTAIPLGSDPIAVAIDPATNLALVADDTDGTVTVLDLGATRSRLATPEPQILQVSPGITLTSSSAVPITIIGAGFVPASQIRLDETSIPTTVVNSRELTASIPVSFLSQPRRVVVDVQNSVSQFSNVFNLLVAQAVPVGNSPLGVAIDQDNDRAVVANSTDGTVSVIDISSPGTNPAFGTVISTVTVGSTPIAPAVVSRIGTAVVTNSGSSTASVIDMTTNPVTVPATVSVGAGPTGVATSESLGSALVVNTGSNSVSEFSASALAGTMATGLGVDAGPLAAAIAPDLNVAVTAQASTSNDAVILDIATGTPAFVNRSTNISIPTGVDYDPVNQVFLIVASGSNTIVTLNTTTLQRTSFRTGVNPTSLSYNFQAGMLLTQNGGSNSLSVVDLPNTRVRDVLPIQGSALYALAIHRRLELVVVSDSANNRVLLFPLPR